MQLVADNDRRQLLSATNRTSLVPRIHNNFADRSFVVAKDPRAEQSAILQSLAAGHELRAIQTPTENISVRELFDHGAFIV